MIIGGMGGRVSNATKPPPSLCPDCGEPTEEGFDGGNDVLYELCTRTRYRPPLDPLYCTFYSAPPRWLAAALAEGG